MQADAILAHPPDISQPIPTLTQILEVPEAEWRPHSQTEADPSHNTTAEGRPEGSQALPEADSEAADALPPPIPTDAALIFEQQIVKFKLKGNWPAVEAIKGLARSLEIELDRRRIRRAVVRETMGRTAGRRAADHRLRAARLGLSQHFSAAEWLALLEFYGYQCGFCGRDTVNLEIDHVTPLGAGGSNRIENIQPLCRDCHPFFHTIGMQVDHRRRWPDWFETD